MNSKYVTDLEHSRKLVAAGWTKETEFWWFKPSNVQARLEQKGANILKAGFTEPEILPAPHTDELLEELMYSSVAMKEARDVIFSSSTPNALADLWCFFKEVKNDY